jgi:hypothetical protein
LLTLNGLTENSFIHPGDKMLVRAATTITATETVTATLAISLNTPTAPISITNTATAVLARIDTPTLLPQAEISGTPQPTIIVIMKTDPPPMKKVDPVLLAIGALVVIGLFLVILGSVTRKAS